MKLVLIRFLIVWLVFNIIILLIEWFRYKRCNLSFHGFVECRMWALTAYVIGINIVILVISVVAPIVHWIITPILN